MARGQLQSVVNHVRRVCARGAWARQGSSALPDAELLERFVRQRDEAAFELLVWRHGAMVLGTCRRVLRRLHDVEDAFQATFLALVRQAASISRGEALAGWLHRVAYRIALRARAEAAARTAVPLGDDGIARCEVQPTDAAPILDEQILDQELARLPDRLRWAAILCYLEGKSTHEAARQLGCPRGTVLSRLAKARLILRTRLTRRGLAPAAVLSGALPATAGAAAVPSVLMDATLNAAVRLAGGDQAAATAHVLALARRATSTLMFGKLPWLAAAAALVLFAGLGVGWWRQQAAAHERGGGERDGGAATAPTRDQAKAADKPKADHDLIRGTWDLVSVTSDGKELDRDRKGKVPMRLIFLRDRIFHKDGERLSNDINTYQLGIAGKLKSIDLDRVGRIGERTHLGIYVLEKDTLKMCLGKERGARPTDFEIKPGSGHVIMILKRSSEQIALDDKTAEKHEKFSLLMRQSSRNLFKISVALLQYAEQHGRLPPAAISSADGKPLLSWRVAILPFLGEDILFNQVKLDQPWDSEHNKQLLARIPDVYAPLVDTKEAHLTFYQVFTGEGTAFEGNMGIKLEDLTDGRGTTILVTEAGEPVPWTKPADLLFAADKKLPKLGGIFDGAFLATFADGHSRFIRPTVDGKLLRAAITRNDGKAIDLEELSKRE